LRRATEINPNFAEAHFGLGNVLKDTKKLTQSLDSYDIAITLKPDFAQALHAKGIVLHELGEFEASLETLNQALSLRPDFSEAHSDRGNTLKALLHLKEALVAYNQAITLNPDYATAYYNRGNVYKDLHQPLLALADYDKSLQLQPDLAYALMNRGMILTELRQADKGLESYDLAFAIDQQIPWLFGHRLHTQAKLCQWIEFQLSQLKLKEGLGQDKELAPPFTVLGFIDQPDLQYQASKIYAAACHPLVAGVGNFPIRQADAKIRVGYYSADFHNHATAYLMAELFEAHDAQGFELYGFSFGPNTQDAMRARCANAFHQFIDVSSRSDLEVAQLSQQLGIDIAVDLKGYTQNARPGIFAHRCAPVQINYLGYPGTMGAPYIDYIIADKTIIPPENQQYYSEQVVYLPHSYQVNDSKRKISERVFTKAELGLPEAGFVFCCFNNNWKILPQTFDIWMRLLHAVEGSVLWLLADNPTAVTNLQKEAQARGVEPSRLVFAPRMPLDEHLARHRLADLFIDTFPCNAHTTASDALWAGLPVLTRMGQSFASRVAGSLLRAMDLPELITETAQDYEAKALELASKPELLNQIKNRLQANRNTSPLFDAKLFARHLEAAFAEMHQRSLSGKAPVVIEVSTHTH